MHWQQCLALRQYLPGSDSTKQSDKTLVISHQIFKVRVQPNGMNEEWMSIIASPGWNTTPSQDHHTGTLGRETMWGNFSCRCKKQACRDQDLKHQPSKQKSHHDNHCPIIQETFWLNVTQSTEHINSMCLVALECIGLLFTKMYSPN